MTASSDPSPGQLSVKAMGFSEAANTAQNMLSQSVRGRPTLEMDRLPSSAVDDL